MAAENTRILFIGDVFGQPGRRALERLLPGLRDELGAELVVANGENAAGGLGLNARTARELWGAGVDLITTGNHVWRHRDLLGLMRDEPGIIRPANFPAGAPGRGWARLESAAGTLTVVNLQGRVYMTPLDCPFQTIDRLLAGELAGEKVAVEMHAEATSEKQGLGWHLDGRVCAVVGSHTHVQTADEKILPQGAAYISDLGLTGPHRSVIGMDPKTAVARLISQRPSGFKVARGDVRLQGALLELDLASGRAAAITRVDREM